MGIAVGRHGRGRNAGKVDAMETAACDKNLKLRTQNLKSLSATDDAIRQTDRQTDGARDSHTTTSNISTQEEDEVLD